MLDRRLESLGTDYVDLFMIHGIGPREYGNDSLNWPKSDELKNVAEKIRKSGKAKFVGFSCHDAKKAEYIQAAADGGFLDVVMLQYSPWVAKDSALNKALDACHKKGIGLISMKQIAGNANALQKEIKQHVPNLLEARAHSRPGASCTRFGPTSESLCRAYRCAMSSTSRRTPRRRRNSSRSRPRSFRGSARPCSQPGRRCATTATGDARSRRERTLRSTTFHDSSPTTIITAIAPRPVANSRSFRKKLATGQTPTSRLRARHA